MSSLVWALIGMVSFILYLWMWRFTCIFLGHYWISYPGFSFAFLASFVWFIYWPLHLASKLGDKAGLRSRRFKTS